MAARVAGRTSSALTIAVFALVAVVSGRAAADPSPPKHPWLTLQRFMACGDCHQDAHHGEFAARNNGECAGCHTVDGFAPGPGTLTAYHSADYGHDGQFELVELTRLISLYNYTNGTSRTGQYHVDSTSADGFGAGP